VAPFEPYPLLRRLPRLLHRFEGIAEHLQKPGRLKESIAAFASEYGSLTRSELEPLSTWTAALTEVRGLRLLVEAADLFEARKTESDRQVLSKQLDATPAMMPARILKESHPEFGDLDLARLLLSIELGVRLSGRFRVLVLAGRADRDDEEKTRKQRSAAIGAIRYVPDSLRTALYLQLAIELAGGRKMRTCLNCGAIFPLKRSDADFCSQRCYDRARRRGETPNRRSRGAGQS